MQGVGAPASDSALYSHGHSLDCVAEMAAIAAYADATVLNVVGMIGTATRLNVQNAAIKSSLLI